MACRRDRVLAVVVIPGLSVLAVRFGDIPIQALTAAGAFQNAPAGRNLPAVSPVQGSNLPQR